MKRLAKLRPAKVPGHGPFASSPSLSVQTALRTIWRVFIVIYVSGLWRRSARLNCTDLLRYYSSCWLLRYVWVSLWLGLPVVADAAGANSLSTPMKNTCAVYIPGRAVQCTTDKFLPRCMKCRRGLAMRIPSVCMSVKRVECDKTEEKSVYAGFYTTRKII